MLGGKQELSSDEDKKSGLSSSRAGNQTVTRRIVVSQFVSKCPRIVDESSDTASKSSLIVFQCSLTGPESSLTVPFLYFFSPKDERVPVILSDARASKPREAPSSGMRAERRTCFGERRTCFEMLIPEIRQPHLHHIR